MARLIAWLGVFIVGCWFGIATEDPPIEYKHITDTEEVTVEKEVPAPYIPQACEDALASASRLSSGARGIDTEGVYLLDFFSAGRIAVVTGDVNQLNDLETQVRQHEEQMLDNIEAVGENQTAFTTALRQCRQEINQ